MNDDKEQYTEAVSEDWWHQYLSEEEKLEQQLAAAPIKSEVIPEKSAPVARERKFILASIKNRVRRHAVKAVSVIGITLVIVHVATVNIRLYKLDREHQRTIVTLVESERLIESERESSAQRSRVVDKERDVVAKREQELALRQQLSEKESTELASELVYLKSSLAKVVLLAQELYALKTEFRHDSLMELEDDKGREDKIREIWTELSDDLNDCGDFERESALIKLRVTQSRALSGEFDQQELDSIDWKTADMQQEQLMILARIYYKQAKNQLAVGRKADARLLLKSAEVLVQSMNRECTEYPYVVAMLSEINGDLNLKGQPKEALKSYLSAAHSLQEVIDEVPANAELRSKLAELCQNMSVMSPDGSSSDWGKRLEQKAHEQATWLVSRYPERKKAHLILAKLEINAAENCVRNGDFASADSLLVKAEQMLKRVDGDTLIQSSLDCVRSFMAWDRGYQTSAMKQMNSQISELMTMVESQPKDVAARCQCAALLRVRSMMQRNQEKANSDNLKALEYLSPVLNGTASIHDMSARRMSARILCDLAEGEMGSGSKTKARDYLIRSGKLWGEMRLKWGVSYEDRELEHWCSRQLTLL